ncbi:mucin-15-like [Sinocyclocheilus anshuiensis]|uniref:Mucin-15-like n=1 Tax=Sinocyclocheilus anshuiensis TaxID=1608454 RepID=A0A671T3J4_9TELE|nr:PREDICTED: mucin-15-like [Sinocyclocheilus anshuiensis]XP_016309865.1 PREDICTED: mucin-15-like [Sinocyclocheilus anshuiensis]
MKLPLGITLALLLILQTFQQVSTQIPDNWKRSNDTTDNNGEQTFSEEITTQPSKENIKNNEDAQAKPESRSENEGQTFGSIYFGQEGEQNSTQLDHSPEQSVSDTEEASSEGPVATPPPPMIALNSSSELSDTSAESNETLTQDTATHTSTPEPEHTNESALNDTYTSPQPETTTAESSHDESGSGYLPSDVPTNSTTKSPTTTTKDESVQNQTTVSPTEPPVYTTTTAAILPAFPEDVTTRAPEDTKLNQTEPIDTRENSERGLSSDVSDGTESKNGQAWTIVLVIGIVVGVLALGAFIFLNRRNRRDFSHRKLVEEMSPDPVLRLDNSEPLDLKFDGFGYYNPGLQGDNIQMTNFPQGRSK